MKAAGVLLAMIGLGYMVWCGVVQPVRETAAMFRLYHVAVQVDVETDYPDRAADAAAVRATLVDALAAAGLHPKESGWPELRVVVHEYRHERSTSANDELVGNVEMTLRRGPAQADVQWSRATPLERRPPGAPIDIRDDVKALVDAFMLENDIPPKPVLRGEPRAL